MDDNNRSLSRTASALQALTYAVPHLAGAIDILVVQQPDGSLKTSPFYVRFGKYTGLRTQDKRVHIAVNDCQLDFCMHLGRTGEVYFVTEVEEEVDDAMSAAEAEAVSEAVLDGMASPPLGYSDEEDAAASPRMKRALLGPAPSRLGLPLEALGAGQGQGRRVREGPKGWSARRSMSEPPSRAVQHSTGQPSSEAWKDEFHTPRTSMDLTAATSSFSAAVTAARQVQQRGPVVTAAASIAASLPPQGDAAVGEGDAQLHPQPHPQLPADQSQQLATASHERASTSPTYGNTSPAHTAAASHLGGGASPAHAPDPQQLHPSTSEGVSSAGAAVSETSLDGEASSQGADPMGRAADSPIPTPGSSALATVPNGSTGRGAAGANGVGNPEVQQPVPLRLPPSPPQTLLPNGGGVGGTGGEPAGAGGQEGAGLAQRSGGHGVSRVSAESAGSGFRQEGTTAGSAGCAAQQGVSEAPRADVGQLDVSPCEPPLGSNRALEAKVSKLGGPEAQASQVGEPEGGGWFTGKGRQGTAEGDGPAAAEVESKNGGSVTPSEGLIQEAVRRLTEEGWEGGPPEYGASGHQQPKAASPISSAELTRDSSTSSDSRGKAPEEATPAAAAAATALSDAPTATTLSDAAAIKEREAAGGSTVEEPEGSAASTHIPATHRPASVQVPAEGDAAGGDLSAQPAMESRVVAAGAAADSAGVSALLSNNGSWEGRLEGDRDEMPAGARTHPPTEDAPVSISQQAQQDMPPTSSRSQPVPIAHQAAQRAVLQDGAAHAEHAASPPTSLAPSGDGGESPTGGMSLGGSPTKEGGVFTTDPPTLAPPPPLEAQHSSQGGSSSEGGAEISEPTLDQSQPLSQSALTAALQGSGPSSTPPLPSSAASLPDALHGMRGSPALAGGQEGQGGGGRGVFLEGGMELSLCWHLLQPEMAPAEVADVFARHLVGPEQYMQYGGAWQELLSRPELACRLGNRVCRWAEALPVVVGVAAFGPGVASALRESIKQAYPTLDPAPEGRSAAASVPTAGEGPQPTLDQSGTSWRGWLFGSWRSGSRKDMAAQAQQAEQQHGREGRGSEKGKEEGEGEGRPGDSQESDAGAGEVVPLSQEAALLMAAAEGRASEAVAVEGAGVRVTEGGRQVVRLKRRTFVPTPAQLQEMGEHLQRGQNTITFTYGKQQLRAYVYMVHWSVRLVISDIDGTITKSDVLGHLGHLLGYDWTHAGITRLFSGIRSNGYDLLFLSSRSIGQASITRDYLHSLEQNGTGMPHGPVIISPDGLFPSLYREVILRRPHEFKIRCLEDIKSLFPPEWNPFYAGFGNRDTDEVSYLAVGVPPAKVFIINPKGALRKASSHARTSTWSTLDSLLELLHPMFPALRAKQQTQHAQQGGAAGEEGGGAEEADDRGGAGGMAVQPTDEREEFNDYNFWRVAPPIVVGSDDEEWGDPEAQGGYDSAAESVDDVADDGSTEIRSGA